MDKVVVTIIGVQRDIYGEENRIELVSIGKHYSKNGVHYILYSDSEITGMDGTSTLLKIGDHDVTLVRKGMVLQEQRFVETECNSCIYKTPYGSLNLSVLTHKLCIAYGAVSGSIAIDYELSVDGALQSENTLQIEVCAACESNKKLN